MVKMKKKGVIEKTNYSGAIVLGLNDALVELSGALVGLSFALTETKTIATVGLITGFAAALSMAASEYLSAKEDKHKAPFKAASRTGLAYIIAVILLVIPYFTLNSAYYATAVMFSMVVIIIASYTFYESKVHTESFRSKFFEMLTITVSVSVISFLFSTLVKRFV